MANVIALALVLVGCGSDDTTPTPAPDPAEPCAGGTIGPDGGPCVTVGVPEDGCAEGFTHDGDAGCQPILPAAPCEPGLLALPGEAECHPVMACGEGTWGDIPVDAGTVYVDASYGGGTSDGTATQPYTTIGEAVDAADDGAIVAITDGTYAENVVLTKPVRLWGVCPQRVIVTGAGTGNGAVDVLVGGDGSEVRGLDLAAINPLGVFVTGAQDVILESLWVHDAPARGINVESSLGPTSITIRDTLVERISGLGIFVAGTEATLERIVIRDILPKPGSLQSGRGISIEPAAGTAAPSMVTMRSAIVERSHELGIQVAGSSATLEALVVRDTFPQASDLMFGRGIGIEPEPATHTPAIVTVTGSVVERNHDYGVFVAGSQATIDGIVVRDTQPRASDGEFGRGIGAHTATLSTEPSSLSVSRTLVARNHELGIVASGSETSLERVYVRDTFPRPSDGTLGRGVQIQPEPSIGVPYPSTVTDSLVERTYEAGLFVIDNQAIVSGLTVRDTYAQQATGVFGDGILVLGQTDAPEVLVSASRVVQSARAGLSNFGCHVALDGNALFCNAFDLAGEAVFDRPFSFEDLGGNACGCPEPNADCKATSAGLVPPEPLGDAP